MNLVRKSVSKMLLFLNPVHFSYLNGTIGKHQSKTTTKMKQSPPTLLEVFLPATLCCEAGGQDAMSPFYPAVS